MLRRRSSRRWASEAPIRQDAATIAQPIRDVSGRMSGPSVSPSAAARPAAARRGRGTATRTRRRSARRSARSPTSSARRRTPCRSRRRPRQRAPSATVAATGSIALTTPPPWSIATTPRPATAPAKLTVPRCGRSDGGTRRDREVDAAVPGGVRASAAPGTARPRRSAARRATTTLARSACTSSTGARRGGREGHRDERRAPRSGIVVRARTGPLTRIDDAGAGGRTGMRRCWPAPRHPEPTRPDGRVDHDRRRLGRAALPAPRRADPPEMVEYREHLGLPG